MGGAPRWLGVEMRHFAALKEVAETGSFSRAASRLGYTQSAISQQVAALERSMGSRLLERPNGTQKVTLTRAGARLLEHAEEIVARMSAAAADLDGLSDEQVVRVGIFQSVAVNLLPRILAELSGRAPEVEVELDERTVDADLLAAVERGDLDLTFGMLPLANGPFESVELLHDPYVVVARADSELARSGTRPTFREIVSLPLIGFHSCRKLAGLVDSEIRGRGLEPRYVMQSDDNATIQALVASGSGIAFVPRLTMNLDDERIVAIPLADEVSPRVLVLARHKHRELSAAAAAFVEAAKIAARGLDQPSNGKAITKSN